MLQPGGFHATGLLQRFLHLFARAIVLGEDGLHQTRGGARCGVTNVDGLHEIFLAEHIFQTTKEGGGVDLHAMIREASLDKHHRAQRASGQQHPNHRSPLQQSRSKHVCL